jgi:hypothetical protein
MFTSIFIGIIEVALNFKRLSSFMGQGFMFGIQLFVLVAITSLILLISRKKNRIAKWIFVILFIFGLPQYIQALSNMLDLGVVGILSALQLVVQCIAIYYLFTPAFSSWMKQQD